MYRGKASTSPHFTPKTNSNVIAFSNSSAIKDKKVYLKIVNYFVKAIQLINNYGLFSKTSHIFKKIEVN